MKTRIEIYEIADPNHIVSDGEGNGPENFRLPTYAIISII